MSAAARRAEARRRAARHAAATAAALLLIAACSPPAAPRAPAADGSCPAARGRSPLSTDAAARRALGTMWRIDAATDTGWRAAQLRATAYLAPGYLAALRAAPTPPSPGGEWAVMAAHRATTSVSVHPGTDEQPPESPTRARRQELVTITPIGRDGWHGPVRTLIVYVTFERACPSAPWLLTTLAVAP